MSERNQFRFGVPRPRVAQPSPKNANGLVDGASAGTQFRNEVVGLGGNAGFVTYGLLIAPVEGVAYRCP
jgi:hypothetical protein